MSRVATQLLSATKTGRRLFSFDCCRIKVDYSTTICSSSYLDIIGRNHLFRAMSSIGGSDNLSSERNHINGDNDVAVFNPKRILILTKLTRLEFEKRTNPHLTAAELETSLRRRGSDYINLVDRHNEHKAYLNTICEELRNEGIEHRVVQRWDYTADNLNWADAVFSAGGDGTFLLAASKVLNRSKPVIGINTDPIGSEGYMCLQKKLSKEHFHQALRRLLDGDFKWLWRQRIRITLRGENAAMYPIELHDQQLLYPEHRWSEHIIEEQEMKLRSSSLITATSPPQRNHTIDQHQLPSSSTHRRTYVRSASDVTSVSPDSSTNVDSSTIVNGIDTDNNNGRQLPVLALNEVFIGESLSSRSITETEFVQFLSEHHHSTKDDTTVAQSQAVNGVSYYELQINDSCTMKQKSSGLTVCTGTGSTSWYFNINKLTDQCVTDLVDIIGNELNIDMPKHNPQTIARICKRFNDQLLFSPDHPKMAYTIRDPVYNTTFKSMAPRGFANRIRVKSRCFDAHLVVDGGLSYIFNDGSEVTMELHAEDALRTVVFR